MAALHEAGLLGAPAEERFDRLTRLARRLLGVPVALVSILDADRQFFLSAQGLPEPWAGLRQTPLAYSFCRSVVETGLPMSVTDAREDARVRGNPAIEDLGVIAYLAVPLALPGGCVIGALCGIDHGPRAWTAAEEGALQDLAGAVEAEMAAGLRLREAEAAAAALRESEERYRALFEAIDSGFCIVEVKFDEEQRPIDYRFVEVNPAFAAQTGLTEAAGKWMRELAPDHEQHWFDIYGRIALTGEAVRFENVAAALRRWYDVYAFRIGAPGAHRIAILFNDISDRRRAETALRESESRYRALFDVSPQMVWFADAEGRCTYVNKHYTDFVGLPAERVLGDGWLAAVHPEDRAGARAAWAGAVASEGDYEVEYRIRRGSDGSHRWFLVRGAPLRGPDGRIERWIGVGVDIDDRRRAEEAQRGLIEALGVAVYTTDAAGRLTFYNEAAVALWGWRPPLHDGRWCGSLRLRWPDGTPMRHEECPMAVALRENRPIRGEEAVAERPDGMHVPFAAYPTPLRDDAAASPAGSTCWWISPSERRPRWPGRRAKRGCNSRLRRAGSPSGSSTWRQVRCCARPSTTRSLATRRRCRRGATRRSWATCCRRTGPRWSAPTAPRSEGGSGEMIECRIRRAGDGAVRWLEMHGRAQRDAGARVVRLHGVLRDVTERKRAQEGLRASEERLRLIVESARDYAIFTTDPQDRIVDWAPGAAAVFGWSAEEAVGRPGAVLFTPEDREAGLPEREVEAARREGAAPNVRWHVRKDGSRVFIEGSVTALREADGSVRGFLRIGQDVTERRRAEEALRASEKRFRRAIGIGTVGVLFFGLDGRMTDANAAFERMSGYSRDELLALDWKVLTPPEFMGATGRAAAELAERGTTEPYEKQHIRKDGSRWWGLFAPTRLSGNGRDCRMRRVHRGHHR